MEAMSQRSTRTFSPLALLTGLIAGLLVINLIRDSMSGLLNVDPGLPASAKLGAAFAVTLTLKFWIPLLVPTCLISALLAAGNVFNRLHNGGRFDDTVVGGLKQIGGAFIAAGFAGCVIVPVLREVDAGQIGGFAWHLDNQDAALGLVGIALTLIADWTRKLRLELEQFV